MAVARGLAPGPQAGPRHPARCACRDDSGAEARGPGGRDAPPARGLPRDRGADAQRPRRGRGTAARRRRRVRGRRHSRLPRPPRRRPTRMGGTTMNLSSPFFTWTCLFPDDASYQFAPHTTWAREGGSAADSSANANANAVLVTSDRPATDLPDLDDFADRKSVV